MSHTTRVSRRAFLALAGALPLATRAAFAASKIPVGIELYSVRDFLAKDLMGTVRAVATLGYEVVEFYAPYLQWTPQIAADVRKLLDDLGIKCPSTHNGNEVFTADGIQKAIDLNQAIGSKAIIMASPGPAKTLDDWKAVSDRLSAAADKLRPLGMVAGYHNHGLEWRPVDGQRPMDIIASRTAKDVVLQFDVGTCVEEGANPTAWITANPGRIKSVHCKDWAAGGKGYAVLFGEGDAPWKPIFEAAESVGGVQYYLIEQEAGPADEQLKRAELCLANWKKLRG
jgi:sugar phosphate isomerase/epimerase